MRLTYRAYGEKGSKMKPAGYWPCLHDSVTGEFVAYYGSNEQEVSP